MDHQAARVADVGQMREQLEAIDEFPACIVTALDAEREHRARTLGRVFLRRRVILAGRQRRVVDPGDQFMFFQMASHGEAVRQMHVHAHCQRLDALQEEKRIEGADARAEIAQAFHARANNERDGAEHFVEVHSMISGRGLGELRESAAGLPIEPAGVHDDSADAVPMAAHELGQRMNHDVAAVIDGPADVGRGEGVVDHQRQAVRVRDGRHRFDIENIAAWVADGLSVEELSVRANGLAEILRIVRLDESDVKPKAPETDIELRVSAAV